MNLGLFRNYWIMISWQKLLFDIDSFIRVNHSDTAAWTWDQTLVRQGEPQTYSASSTEFGTILSSASTNPSLEVSEWDVPPYLTITSTVAVSRTNPILSHIVLCTQHQDKHTAVSDTPLVTATNHAVYRRPPIIHTHADHLQINEQVQKLPFAIIECQDTSPGLGCGDMPGLVEGDSVTVTGEGSRQGVADYFSLSHNFRLGGTRPLAVRGMPVLASNCRLWVVPDHLVVCPWEGGSQSASDTV